MVAIYKPTNMIVCYDNRISPDSVTSVSDTNFTATAPFSETNLEYEDPGRLYKVTSVGSSPQYVEFQLDTTYQVDCFGIYRHNLYSSQGAPPVLELQYYSGGWVSMSPGSGMVIAHDYDHAVVYDTTINDDRFRIEFTGVSNPFYVGGFFLGMHREVDMNPRDGRMAMSVQMPYIITETSGSVKYVVNRGDIDPKTLSMEWTRLQQSEVEFWNSTLRQPSNRTRILGVIDPLNYTDVAASSTTAYGLPAFFGYLQSIDTLPRSSYLADRRYDMRVQMFGV